MDVGDFSVSAAPTITDVSLKAVVVHIAADLHLEVLKKIMMSFSLGLKLSFQQL